MKSWSYASVFNTYGLCPKEKKRETINGLVNGFINEAKRAGKEKPKGK